MATPVVFNGVTYSIPAYGDTGYAQGSGNLSSYLIALAGGPFPFTSQTANPATAGTIRLAKTDTIDWRNNANSGNLPLGINGSDQLEFNGVVLATNGGGTVNTGTSGNISYYATTGTALSDAGIARTNLFLADGSIAATGAFNLNSHKITNLTNGSSPQDAATFSQVSGLGTVNSGTANHLAYYATSTNAVSNSTPLTISGNTLSVSGTSAQETISTGDTSTATLNLNSTAYSTSLQALNTGFTLLHDDTNSTNILVYQASDKSVAIHGTNAGSSGSSGFVGEWINAQADFPQNWPVVSGAVFDAASISLTGGDWDVSLTGFNSGNGATLADFEMFIGLVAGNNQTGEVIPNNGAFFAGPTQGSLCVPTLRMSLSSTTTVYAKFKSHFSGGTPEYGVRISARRMR